MDAEPPASEPPEALRPPSRRMWWAWLLAGAALLAAAGVGGWLVMRDDREAEVLAHLATTTAPPTTVAASTTTSSTPPAEPALATTLRGGSVGDDVAMVQERLEELGFLVGEVDGRFGPRTEQAVWAYKKLVLGADPVALASDPAASDVTQDTWQSIRDTAPITPRRDVEGTSVEVYIDAQVVAVFVDGDAELIAHATSGDGASWCEEITYDTGADGKVLETPFTGRECGVGRTPGGAFAVSVEHSGVRLTPIGTMTDPVFFNHTIAIHGVGRAPLTPSTRGGIGVADALAARIGELVESGDPVLVWGEDGREPETFSAEESLPTFNTLDPECLIGLYTLEEGDTRALIAERFDITEVDLNGANVATDGYLEFLPGLQIIIPPRDCPPAPPSTEG